MIYGILGALLGLAICLFLCYLFNPRVETQTIMMSSDDDPQLKFIAECRSTLVQNICNVFCDALNVKPKDLDTEIETVGANINLITICYQNHLFRIHCIWEKKKIYLSHLTNEDGRHFGDKHLYRIHHGLINLSRLYIYLTKFSDKTLTLDKEYIDRIIDIAKKSEEFEITDVDKIPANIWKSLKDKLLDRASEDDIKTFAELSVYLHQNGYDLDKLKDEEDHE